MRHEKSLRSEGAVSKGKRDLQELLARGHGKRLRRDGGGRRRVGEGLFDSVHAEAAGRMAAFEAREHFARLIVLPRLVIKNAERRIAARPFGEKLDRAFELSGGLRRIAAKGGDYAEAPEYFSGGRHASEAAVERGLRVGQIAGAKLNKREREIVLVVVG